MAKAKEDNKETKKKPTRSEATGKKKCTRCGSYADVDADFLVSYSKMNKSSIRSSICKKCIAEVYEEYLAEYGDERKALFRLCMLLDVKYDSKVANSIIVKASNDNNVHVARSYMGKMGLRQFRQKTFNDSDDIINIWSMSNEELDELVNNEDTYKMSKSDEERIKEEILTTEVIRRWGYGRTPQDYQFLEDRYSTLVEAYNSKNPTSLWDYQELSLLYLDLRNNRDNPTNLKSINEQIGKIQDRNKLTLKQQDVDTDEASFGVFIQKIEEEEPCEDRLEEFEDVDGIFYYIKKWLVKPFAIARGLSQKEKDVVYSDEDENLAIDEEDLEYIDYRKEE